MSEEALMLILIQLIYLSKDLWYYDLHQYCHYCQCYCRCHHHHQPLSDSADIGLLSLRNRHQISQHNLSQKSTVTKIPLHTPSVKLIVTIGNNITIRYFKIWLLGSHYKYDTYYDFNQLYDFGHNKLHGTHQLLYTTCPLLHTTSFIPSSIYCPQFSNYLE